MCFYVRNTKKEATLYEALEDIVCYKILRKDLSSPYLYYEYTLNKEVKVKLKIPRHINEDGDLQFKLYNKYPDNCTITRINKGLHSYSSLKRARENANGFMFSKYYVFKCIIPKGALFYRDDINKEYVSDKLIIIKQIK
jgi:hypothetical protein